MDEPDRGLLRDRSRTGIHRTGGPDPPMPAEEKESSRAAEGAEILIPVRAGGDDFAARSLTPLSSRPGQLEASPPTKVGNFRHFAVAWSGVSLPAATRRRLEMIAAQWSGSLSAAQPGESRPDGIRGCSRRSPVSEDLSHSVRPRKHSRLAEAFAANFENSVSGILLHGPSGVGKSLTARALATAVRLPCLELQAADIRSRWFGESERLLREAFKSAREAAPCVLLLDDVEQVAGHRAHLTSESDAKGVEYRILSTLLNCLDGIDTGNPSGAGGPGGLGGKRVFVIACTRNLEAVDDALLRPGRLEILLELQQPVRKSEIHRLLKTHSENFQLPLHPSVDLEALSGRLEQQQSESSDDTQQQLSAADICEILRSAALNALRRDIESREILPEDIEKALGTEV